MNWKSYLKPVGVQVLGQALLAGLIWYWLGLGVATTALVAANAALALVVLAGFSALAAYCLEAPRRWWWLVPVVALPALGAVHVALVILVVFAWVIVLLPSVSAGKLKVNYAPGYVAVCLGILLLMVVLPIALINWVPAVGGFSSQAASLGLRAGLAFLLFAGGWASLLKFIGSSSRAEIV